jgi:hypothetical protein
MYVLISTSSYDLWENDIDIGVFQFIYLRSSKIHRPDQIYKLARNDILVIEAFRAYYGFTLEKCKFATLQSIPDCLQQYYSIDRIQCYKYVYYPESIVIDKTRFWNDEMNKLKANMSVSEDKKTQIKKEISYLLNQY